MLWGDYVDSLERNKTYKFQDLCLKVSKMERYLNTPKSEKCHFEETTPFLGNVVTVDHRVANLSKSVISAKILDIQTISKNFSCVSCSRKVKAKSATIGSCESCNLMQKIGSCGELWYLRAVVQNVTNKKENLKLAMFNQAIQKLATLLGMDVDLSTISEHLILFILESSNSLDIVYDNVDNKVIDIVDCPPKESTV